MLGILKRWLGGGSGKGRGGVRPDEGSDLISCHEALAVINEYVDGELAGLPHEEVAEHFRVCARCYPHLKMEERFRSRVQEALGRPEVPEDLRARVLDILAEEPDEG